MYAINNKESFLVLEQLKKDIDKHKDKKECALQKCQHLTENL